MTMLWNTAIKNAYWIVPMRIYVYTVDTYLDVCMYSHKYIYICVCVCLCVCVHIHTQTYDIRTQRGSIRKNHNGVQKLEKEKRTQCCPSILHVVPKFGSYGFPEAVHGWIYQKLPRSTSQKTLVENWVCTWLHLFPDANQVAKIWRTRMVWTSTWLQLNHSCCWNLAIQCSFASCTSAWMSWNKSGVFSKCPIILLLANHTPPQKKT